ncbi:MULTISPECIES: H-type small acid-soluble spore protein [Clostridium]|uniref:H-type small acid-soluble spore protein n=1 Tax=Clostridium TaxID=1485 RepID=UPI000825E64E|nr:MULTISPECIES: H-type small acid-soluble spore protein [Clostridium]PJI06704.1 H-type small acid-soluble spore protein [Clostridium sp. CT7]
MDKKRVKEILSSKGVINVNYKNDPVWLEPISTDKDGEIQVKSIRTNEHFIVNIKDLKE